MNTLNKIIKQEIIKGINKTLKLRVGRDSDAITSLISKEKGTIRIRMLTNLIEITIYPFTETYPTRAHYDLNEPNSLENAITKTITAFNQI